MRINQMKEYGFYRGINLGGWLSQCDYSEERLNGFITEEDFVKIASWGLDHVRVPVDYNILENPDGTICESGFARLTWAHAQCLKNGLKLVIDLHKTAGFSFDDYGEDEHGFFESEAYQERFYRLWEALARGFGSCPESIAFELLNEVTDASYIDAWNRIASACIARIRLYAPETLILVGSYHNNSALTVGALDAPYDDRVVYNMHCYEPLVFTHQGAYWTDAIDPARRIPFAQAGIDEAYFEELFSGAIAKAEQEHTGLYCGEYGCINLISPEDTLAWLRTIHAVYERYAIARCVWNYKELDFGLSDVRLDGVREELLTLL